ncbi:MAG: hypothetical protein RR416_04075 [Clostridia bacterium]
MKKPVFWLILVIAAVVVALFDVASGIVIAVQLIGASKGAWLINANLWALFVALTIANVALVGAFVTYVVARKE